MCHLTILLDYISSTLLPFTSPLIFFLLPEGNKSADIGDTFCAQHTLRLLTEADELKIPMVWLQPGSYDDIVYAAVKENDILDRVLFAGDRDVPSDSSDSEPSTPDGEGLLPHHAGISHFFHHLLHTDNKSASDPDEPIEDGGPCGTITALRRAGSTIAKDFTATKDYAKSTFNVEG